MRIQAVTDDLAESLGLDKPRGALVSEVSEDGPAKKGGIRVGDVIVRFNGTDVPQMRDLPRIVADTEINKKSRSRLSGAVKQNADHCYRSPRRAAGAKNRCRAERAGK
ncbi:MAG: hypothetical protein CM15mP21_0590 [Hyphomicrobiales bacterium]|nr:MAG: hypothetical protein CM15mP21_0590 [Hyphomicrobiales bacterium]